MNLGQFNIQVNVAWDILKKLDLNEARVYHPTYPTNPGSVFRPLGYVETWRRCFREDHYDFQLKDDSLIQFRVESFNPLRMSYVYYECPYSQNISFYEFLQNSFDIEDGEYRQYQKKDFEEEYYSCLDAKEVYTPIRYDYSPDMYTEGLHPASHIHFGHKSNIRVGTKKILLPISFLCFIIRQVYPVKWQKFIDIPESELLIRNVRDNLTDVEPNYWNRLDSWEMCLI
jgi:hypothetical protein